MFCVKWENTRIEDNFILLKRVENVAGVELICRLGYVKEIFYNLTLLIQGFWRVDFTGGRILSNFRI